MPPRDSTLKVLVRVVVTVTIAMGRRVAIIHRSSAEVILLFIITAVVQITGHWSHTVVVHASSEVVVHHAR